jgi:hypothetical protein
MPPDNERKLKSVSTTSLISLAMGKGLRVNAIAQITGQDSPESFKSTRVWIFCPCHASE